MYNGNNTREKETQIMTITFFDAENNEIDMMGIYDCCDSEMMEIAANSAPGDAVRFEVESGSVVRVFSL